MAVLQKIRNRAGVLIIIFVGVALFLFIIDPSTFDGLFNKRETNIAEINGEKIPYVLYQNKVDREIEFMKTAQQRNTLDENTIKEIRERVWNNLFNEYLLSESFEELGISVSEDELNNMLWGSNIHPLIQQNFSNRETGTLDTMYVRQFFNQADQAPDTKIIAEFFKSSIKRDKLNQKYQTLMQKGFYSPGPLAEMKYVEETEKVDIVVASKMYESIPDEEVDFTEKDLKTYYDDHKYMFENEESSREIEYVTFEVEPSDEDVEMLRKEMKEIRTKFSLTDDINAFVNMHSDYISNKLYYKGPEVPGGYGKVVFEEMDTNFVSDVIETDSSFIVFKVEKFETVPDSVKARHILISPDSTTTLEQANNLIDSLKTEVENGAPFEMLARTFSQGPSGQNGGDLGWFKPGMMVKAFNDACFYGDEGDLTIVETQFGVHLVWVEKQSDKYPMVKLAVINKKVTHSDNTYDKYYADASRFRDEYGTATSFDEGIKDKKLVKRIASNISENDLEIPGIEDARQIVRWTYQEEQGAISKVFVVGTDKFIVAKLNSVRDEGISEFDQVKEQIEPIVIQKKKAEKLMKELESYAASKDISEAVSVGAKIDTAKNISFNSFAIPQLGIEPKLIGQAVNLEVNKKGGPVEGNKGVYVYKVINRVEAPETEDYNSQKMREIQTFTQRVAYELVDALEKASDIEDNRSEFF